MTPSEILRAARAKIDTPERWTKGDYARHQNGNPIRYDCKNAACWCGMGAVLAVCNQDPPTYFLHRAAVVNFIAFNDDPETTHADVMAMFDRAIALAEKEEAK